jgi:UDP-N-acetylglucosamine transferase subunit ALG13
MILIIVGTASFPFYRMNDVFDRILRKRKNQERIVYQHGTTPVVRIREPNVTVETIFPFEQLQHFMKEARVIIAHGGLATIYQAIRANNTPHVLARRKEFHEHVDNHQVFFTEYLIREKLIYPLLPDGPDNFSKPSRGQNGSIFSDSTQRLCGYLDSIVKNGI